MSVNICVVQFRPPGVGTALRRRCSSRPGQSQLGGRTITALDSPGPGAGNQVVPKIARDRQEMLFFGYMKVIYVTGVP